MLYIASFYNFTVYIKKMHVFFLLIVLTHKFCNNCDFKELLESETWKAMSTKYDWLKHSLRYAVSTTTVGGCVTFWRVQFVTLFAVS